MKHTQQGFTVVEVMIVTSVSALFIALVTYFGLSYWRYASLIEADLDVFVSRLNAQDFVREIIGTSDGLITQNSIADPNAAVSDPIAGPEYWSELHAVPGNIPTTAGAVTPLLYFQRIAIDTNGNIAMNGTTPYNDEYVLYIDGTTKQLRLRTLANPDAPSNRLETSCPPALATTSCPEDRLILEQLDSVDVIYYSRSGNTINYQSITDPITGAYIGPDLPLVEALQYTFHIKGKPLFQTGNATINDTIVRIALRNI